jgi:uncharacterized protein YwgA
VVETEDGSTESLDAYRDEVEEDRDEIEQAIEVRNEAQRLLSEFKETVPDQLEEERKSLKRKADYREGKIDDTKQEWNTE